MNKADKRNSIYRTIIYPLVACILMHDQITHGTLFNSFRHSWFRATSCTLRFWKAGRNFGSLILISAVKNREVFGRKAICNDYSVPLTKKWNVCTFNLTGSIGSTWWKVIHKNNHGIGNKNGRHIDLPFFISSQSGRLAILLTIRLLT